MSQRGKMKAILEEVVPPFLQQPLTLNDVSCDTGGDHTAGEPKRSSPPPKGNSSRLRELLKKLHEKEETFHHAMRRFDSSSRMPPFQSSGQLQNPSIVTPSSRGLKRWQTGNLEDADLRHFRERRALISLLQQSVTAAEAELAQGTRRLNAMKTSLSTLDTGWQSKPRSAREDPTAIKKHYQRIVYLATAIQDCRRLGAVVVPRIQALSAAIQRHRTLLRENIEMAIKWNWVQHRDVVAIVRELERPFPSALLRKSNANRQLSALTLKTDTESFLLAIHDPELREFFDAQPHHLRNLTLFPRAGELLERLQLDGTSLYFENFGVDNIVRSMSTTSDDRKSAEEILQLVVEVIAHWMESNPYFYRLGLEECQLPSTAWRHIALRVKNAARLCDFSISRCPLALDDFRHLFDAFQSNPLETIHLGHTQLGDEGAKLFVQYVMQTCQQHLKPHHLFPTTSASVACDNNSSDMLGNLHPFEERSGGLGSVSFGRDNDPSTSPIPSNRAINGALVFSLEDIAEDHAEVELSAEDRSSNPNIQICHLGTMATTSSANVHNQSDSLANSPSLSLRQDYDGHCLPRTPKLPLTSLQCLPSVFANSVRELHLPGNNLGDCGAIQMAEMVKMCALPHLRCLDLRWNEICVEGAVSFATAFQFLSSSPGDLSMRLSSTRSSHHSPTSPESGADGSSPPYSTYSQPLEVLNLAGNLIQANGAASLVSALALSRRLPVLELDISMNRIGNGIIPSLLVLVSSLPYNMLDCLHISLEWSEIDDVDGVLRLATAMSRIPPPSGDGSSQFFASAYQPENSDDGRTVDRKISVSADKFFTKMPEATDGKTVAELAEKEKVCEIEIVDDLVVSGTEEKPFSSQRIINSVINLSNNDLEGVKSKLIRLATHGRLQV